MGVGNKIPLFFELRAFDVHRDPEPVRAWLDANEPRLSWCESKGRYLLRSGAPERD